MHLLLFTLWSVIATGLTIDTASSDLKLKTERSAAHLNANHIFNAIHSSTRQWGSSLNHNGMSFFLASVPEGTQLYHGRPTNESVKGTEWLAFEPEHALEFAWPRSRYPPPEDDERGLLPLTEGDVDQVNAGRHRSESNELRRGKHWSMLRGFWRHKGRLEHPDGTESGPRAEHDSSNGFGQEEERDNPSEKGHSPSRHSSADSEWLGDAPNGKSELRSRPMLVAPGVDEGRLQQQELLQAEKENGDQGGYLHTYRTKHPLSLLYIDGMSAGKTNKGTLDSTDLVLQPFNISLKNPMMGEWERARGLCNMSIDLWDGRIDGFLRMEMGFEIILCDFEEHLDLESVSLTSRKGPEKGFGTELSYYRAVASRFDGIGGNRVQVDYDSFVTSFGYDVDLFEGNAEHPRLVNTSNTTRAEIRKDVTDMILSHAFRANVETKERTSGHNWQKVADMVVDRYADRLAYLSSSSVQSLNQMQAEIETLLAPYIDYSNRSNRSEIERCADQYLPPFSLTCPSPLARKAIHTITSRLCETFVNAMHARTLESAQASIQSLMDYLRWTSWKKCGSCKLDEVCFIAIWPLGREQDHTRPTCQSKVPHSWNDSYWGGFGGPRRRERGKRTRDREWTDFDYEDPGDEDHRQDEIFEHSPYEGDWHSAFPEERDHFLD